jgi:gliding motility-associated-like protein
MIQKNKNLVFFPSPNSWRGKVFLFLALIFSCANVSSQSSFIQRVDKEVIQGNYYNDSIYYGKQTINDYANVEFDLNSTQKIKTHIIHKLNIKSKKYQKRILSLVYDSISYTDSGSYTFHDKYGRIYSVYNMYAKPSFQQFTLVNRLDTGYNIIWSKKLPGSHIEFYNLTHLNQFIDSFLYIATEISSGSQKWAQIHRLSPSGNLDLVKKLTPFKIPYGHFIIRDSFIFMTTDSGITRFNRHLQPINSMGNAAGITFYPNFYDYYAAHNSSNLSGIRYLFSANRGNTSCDYVLFAEFDFSKIYRIKHYNFTNMNHHNMNIDRDNFIHMYYYTSRSEETYGIRYVKIAPDWKTLVKNTFYGFPSIQPRYVNDFLKFSKLPLLRCTRGQVFGGFYNDTTFLMNIRFMCDTCQPKFVGESDLLYIKNHDFSIFPYSQEICGESFQVDTFYPTARGLPYLSDTMFSLDTFICSYQKGPWIDATVLPTQYESLGQLIARFTLSPDTFCGTRVNLRSDTALKYGESKWVLNYLDTSFTETFIAKDTLNFLFKRAGRIEITHIHTLRGCTDTFRDTAYFSRPLSYSIAKDTLLCSPLSYKMNAKNNSFYSYLWSTGSTDTAITVTDTGTFWVRKTGVCGSFTDTIKLRWKTPLLTTPIFALDSLILCGVSFPYTLNSNITGASFTYTWNPAHINSSSRSLSSFGNYRLTVTDNCHIYIDSFKLIAKVVATPPTHPDSVSLCATTYKITRPQNLTLEEKFVNSWLSRDSIILSKNEKKTFRWTDSCGTVTYDSIYDYQRGTFPPYPKTQKLCETFASFVLNTIPTIQQYEFVTLWQLNNNITLKLGSNYIRRDDNCGNQQFDTILGYSTKTTKNIITPDSLVLCPQEFPYLLSVSDTFRTYLWSNGDNLHYSKLKIKNSKFYVTVTDNCYAYTDSIEVREITTPSEIALEEIYRELCKALEKTRVETKLVYPQYIWNQTPSTKFFYIADTSQNLVTLYIPRRCDTLKDSLPLSWIDPALLPPSYTVDSSYCKQAAGAVKLTLTNKTDYLSYLWKGDSLPYIFVNTLGTTKFFAKNLCYERYFDIPPYSCPLDPIGLPQAFSPNGDNLNDSWGLQGAKNIILYNLSIFNRWGEKIFETTDPNIQWNGSYRGEPAPLGSYQYYIDYEYTPQGIRKTHRGEVTVVR